MDFKTRLFQVHQRAEDFFTGFNEVTVSTLLRSILISIILLIVPTLIIYNVDKVKQIVFYEHLNDPAISTFFVFMMCVLNIYIFTHRKRSFSKTENILKRAGRISHFMVWAIVLLPQIVWTLVLFALMNDQQSNGVSIILSIVFLFVLIYSGNVFFYDKYFDDGNGKSIVGIIDSFVEKTATVIGLRLLLRQNPSRSKYNEENYQEFNYYRLTRLVFFGILVPFVYNFINYEMVDVKSATSANLVNSVGVVLLGLVSLAWIGFAYRYWFYLNYFLRTTEEFPFSKGLLNFIFLVITSGSIVVFIYVGSIRTFDVIILYFISLRYLIFLLAISYHKLFTGWQELKTVGRVDTNYFKFGLSLLFIALLIGFTIDFFFGDNKNERSLYHFEDRYSSISQEEIPTANEYIRNWLTADSIALSNNQPIILVLGQGGGSRAGATMFNALSRLHLDPVSNMGRNILAIISISGSSNGAGFYLGIRRNGSSLLNDLGNVLENTKSLYRQDYVTGSLYKMLFTDPVFTTITSLRKLFYKRVNRNDYLIDLENEHLVSLLIKSGSQDSNFKKSIIREPWLDVYWGENSSELPLFFPVTYNVSQAKVALSSPVKLDMNDPFIYSISDSLFNSGRDLIMGESIALSEMFPFISASAGIRCCDNSDLVDNYMDGGVYDNVAFEVGKKVYRFVAELRDSVSPGRPIVLLSVQNGALDAVPEEQYSDVGSVMTSATNSIFISNVKSHQYELRQELKTNHLDTLLILKSYSRSEDSSIVMSRFLTSREIEDIDRRVKSDLSGNLMVNGFAPKFSIYFDLNEYEDSFQCRDLLKVWKSRLEHARVVKITPYCDKLARGEDPNINEIYAKLRIDFIKRELSYFRQENGFKFEIVTVNFDRDKHVGKSSSVIRRNLERRVDVEIL